MIRTLMNAGMIAGLMMLLTACATTGPGQRPASSSIPASAPVSYLPKAEQCVPYARRISGIELYGDAYTWWDRASPHYQCGQVPQVGAVLVLARTQKMREGHVAVVNKVLGARMIEVTHSNWGNDSSNRKILYHAMKVQDISANNDWTRVKFWNYEKNVFGFPYAAKGFIYPKGMAVNTANNPISNGAASPSLQSLPQTSPPADHDLSPAN